jgi:hypothetical protein
MSARTPQAGDRIQVPVQAILDGPSVTRKVDGPLLVWACNIHFLTWRERLRIFLRLASIDKIGCERFPWLAKQRMHLILTLADSEGQS